MGCDGCKLWWFIAVCDVCVAFLLCWAVGAWDDDLPEQALFGLFELDSVVGRAFFTAWEGSTIWAVWGAEGGRRHSGGTSKLEALRRVSPSMLVARAPSRQVRPERRTGKANLFDDLL